MIRAALLALGVVAALVPRGTEAASSINTAQPAQGVPYNAAPIRSNFAAAASDIAALQSLNAGASAPSGATTGTLWLETPNAGNTYTLNIYLSTTQTWVPVASLDKATGLWSPPVGGGAIPSIVSAATTNLGSVDQAAVYVTGNQSIASFGSAVPEGQVKFVVFTGTPTLIHNATYLILPTGANLTMPAGQGVTALSLGQGKWRILANGNVFGPASSTANELASFNSTTGSVLRQGAATLTDSKTSAITADGGALAVMSKSGITAEQIYEWAIGPGSNPAPSYDGIRGVVEQPLGSTVLDVNAVAGYVVNRNTRAGSPATQVTGALKGIGVCAVDDSSCWGIFTILADNEGINLSAGTGRFLFNEFDYNVTSPNTVIGGIIGGTWLAQPAGASGMTVFKPTGTGVWDYAFGGAAGCCTTAFYIGPSQSSGSNIPSQNLDFHFYDAGGVDRTTTLVAGINGFAISTSGTAAQGSLALLKAGAIYNTTDTGGYQVNSKTVATVSGTAASIAPDVTFTAVGVGSTNAPLTLHASTVVSIASGKPLQMAGPINLTPAAAPAAPASGWYIYTDSGDANRLKIIASTGTVVTLGTP